jgi:hypothetical protein
VKPTSPPNPVPESRESERFSFSSLPLVARYLLVYAACGWLVLMGNLFHLDDKTGWLFPEVEDLAALTASSLLLAVLALTPAAFKALVSTRRTEK